MQNRYSRQTLFPPLGLDGQSLLQRASVLILGCGALGTAFANNLARAGVGRLLIADRDYVELNNLQRQILFDESDASQRLPKAIAAQKKIQSINSEVTVIPIVEHINAENLEIYAQQVDLVLDATDNFETRYVLNDVCVKWNRPWIYSGVVAAYGVTMNILPGKTACLRCAFPDLPLPGSTPTCDTSGVLNGIVATITGIASTEALKILLKKEDKVSHNLTWLDLWENTFEQLILPRQDDCPSCSLFQFDFLESHFSSRSTSLCGRNAVQIAPPRRKFPLDFVSLSQRLSPLGSVSFNQYILRLQVDGIDLTLFPDSRAIIKGTDNEDLALSLYTRYIGL